mmetsp:Transcript_45249/g.130657  ORF Transcript_45249/g.130657 Transcript_45249/m.130657 type:complete len:108 (-) Transcript_45249:81-404(-)
MRSTCLRGTSACRIGVKPQTREAHAKLCRCGLRSAASFQDAGEARARRGGAARGLSKKALAAEAFAQQALCRADITEATLLRAISLVPMPLQKRSHVAPSGAQAPFT